VSKDYLVQETDKPGLGEVTAAFARIGLVSFGGPAGQIALMHRVLVDEKRWLDEARFLHALNYCMLLPGPEAMQLATYSGWLLHGVRGGLIAGLLFLLPGAFVLVALSVVYLVAGEVTVVQGLLFGLKAAVLAIVLEALLKVSKRALKSRWAIVLALATFIAITVLKVPFPLVMLAALLIGIAAHFLGAGQPAPDTSPATGEPADSSLAQFVKTLALWLVIWLGPLALLHLALGRDHVFTQEGDFFSVMAAVTFGGAYAVLAWVAQQAVEVYGWLKPDEMLTGLGLAETTPGPLILVLVFVGFLGGARLSGLDPVVGGLGGALVALWFTFVPSFLFIFAGAPYLETVRNVRWLATALSAVTAAVVGVIANLAVWFGLHVLFAEIRTVAVGPVDVAVPVLASVDMASVLIAIAAGVALTGFKLNLFAVLAGAALAGIVVSGLA
jgi:chromate transporter